MRGNISQRIELSYDIRDKQIYNRNRNCHVATDVYLTSHTKRLNHSLTISSLMKKMYVGYLQIKSSNPDSEKTLSS